MSCLSLLVVVDGAVFGDAMSRLSMPVVVDVAGVEVMSMRFSVPVVACFVVVFNGGGAWLRLDIEFCASSIGLASDVKAGLASVIGVGSGVWCSSRNVVSPVLFISADSIRC